MHHKNNTLAALVQMCAQTSMLWVALSILPSPLMSHLVSPHATNLSNKDSLTCHQSERISLVPKIR